MTHWVDAIIVAVLVLATLRGWQTGGVRQLLTYAGLGAGFVTGVIVVPTVARHVTSGWAPVVAIAILIVAAAFGAWLGGMVGSRVALDARRVHLGWVDRVLGVAIAAVAMLLIVWIVGTLAAASRIAAVDRGVRESSILRAITAAMPTLPEVFARIETDLAVRGIPIVFAMLPPAFLPPVPQPSAAAVAGVRSAAGPSTVKVTGPACGKIVEGSGFVVAPGVVVTNAHVVAGDQHPTIVVGSTTYAAAAIGFDPGLDVAVLRVPGLMAPVLPTDPAIAERGTPAVALGYPGGGPLVAVPASVDGLFLATGLDIYGSGFVSRQIYQMHAAIRPGDSGGPLVRADRTHRVAIGLVFAQSTVDPAVGYALAMGPVLRDVAAAKQGGHSVTTGACAG